MYLHVVLSNTAYWKQHNPLCDGEESVPFCGFIMVDDGDQEKLKDSKSEALGAYKRVDKKIKPIPGVFPQEARVKRCFPEDPLLSLPELPFIPPEFVPTKKLTLERIRKLDINASGFLWPEEVKLFLFIFTLNEDALAFSEEERGNLRDDYFSPYIMPVVPHIPWTKPNIPIPPGIKERVVQLLREKIAAGLYEPSQASYRSKWFCVLKKNGKLRIVHDLQPLNEISIKTTGAPPILDDFVEPYAGRLCYTVFDLLSGFNARIITAISKDITSFLTPLGLLRLTAIPQGYTNSPAEFQQCMVFILQEEIPHIANIFIDDLPVKGPSTDNADENDNPEVLKENPNIRRFI